MHTKKSKSNIRGKKFGNLLVIKPSNKLKKNKLWVCQCVCGNTVEVQYSNLTSGNTKSCGCYRQIVNRSRQTYPGTPAQRVAFRNYARRAPMRGFTFELTPEEFYKLCSENCTYCGVPPQLENKVYDYRTKKQNGEVFIRNGIDRIDNTIGYTTDNCIPCCTTCNFAKREMTVLEFLKWVATVNAHMNNKEVFSEGSGI